MKLLLLLLTAVTIVKAQNVPDCVTACVDQAINGSCTNYNDACFCTPAFQQAVGPCILSTCDSADIATALALQQNLCGGPPVYTSPPPVSSPPVYSPPSSTTSSPQYYPPPPSYQYNPFPLGITACNPSPSSSSACNPSPSSSSACNPPPSISSASNPFPPSNAASARAEFGYGSPITLGVAVVGAAIGGLVI